ncbi:MAG: hypothetical protein M1820_009372 [Bogoriella megaspora]|nr:MAG: hypothetical protein M1820_009372 [Bogoriella megaspora]
MPATSPAYSYYPTTSIPINMPQKTNYYAQPQYTQAHRQPYSRISASPPEVADSVTTSGVPSYVPSATSSSYAGSASDYDTSSSGGAPAANVDMLEYMNDRLSGAYDPTAMDRSLAKQAQTSGQINAKTRELLELQALARRRLAATQANFADGLKAAKETQRDLQWTQKRVSQLNQRAAQKYPAQYKVATSRYPAPVEY